MRGALPPRRGGAPPGGPKRGPPPAPGGPRRPAPPSPQRWGGGGDGGAHRAAPPAGIVQPALPVLLVAIEVERGVEAADPLERAPPDGEVGAPHELGVAVVGPEVEGGDGRRLAAAGVQVGALEIRLDRA